MKVFTAALGTETNTFAALPTGMQNFRETCLFRGGSYGGQPPPFGAPLAVWRRRAEARGWAVVESLCAFAQPAGLTVRKVYEDFRDEILGDLRQAMPLDMVLVSLHGAMVADGYDDCEGDLLQRIRAVVGSQVPVGAELDLHCHVTPAMLANATALVLFKEYPHIDAADRADELFTLIADAATGKTRPVMALWDCRMIGVFHTTRQPMRGFVDKLTAEEGKDGVLSLSFVHGFPWGDVAEMGAGMLAVTDGDATQAARLAASLGREIYDIREAAQPTYLSLDAALDRAVRHNNRPVILADVSDNAGGGAASDSTFMLEAMLKRGIREAALGMIWDPIAVQLAFEVGEGASLDLRLGGKMGPASGAPLDVRARVLQLGRDVKTSGMARGSVQSIGDAAALEIDGIQVVVNTIRGQCLSRDSFAELGIDIARQKIVVVKSMQHFHASFAPAAADVLYVAAPGALTPDFTRLPYRKIDRRKWPLVADPFA
jgi:microcystin degradation protein MlrC